MRTKITSKGYTIRKSQVNQQVIDKITKELTVSPNVCPGYGNEEAVPYQIYKENDKKYYLPFYYGKKKFGKPNDVELPPPSAINITFSKELRDYQKEIVSTYKKHVTDDYGGGIISVGCGRGKTVMELKNY